MITRSKLVEQLRDYQIRSQRRCRALVFFSPKAHLASWVDVAVAILLGLVFGMLVVSAYAALCYRRFLLTIFLLFLAVALPLRLRLQRLAWARKRERRLPLSL
ncbi:hypothetical protein SAY87_020341 [Trapa incisa]|uniref:Uncharacterized protein n=2 Tax=Trapa TaxID=22665 RepID=A0AAN7LUG1_TRANT|nr:hypothetical protein SAY87_020341 [Trapa incisa]KAK4792971.1 hypothetical protein SAY86_023406 [Trapa natans]